jgi:uncharacterized protein YndB with AHSA1/START domain
MKKEKFSINIKASAKKVWQVLWSDATYRQWTKIFSEGISDGSYAVSDWKQGSKIQFISSSGDGMFAIISELKPYERMAFSHQGEVKNFKEQPPKEGAESWTGAQEIYTLTEKDGNTNLEVTMDITSEYEQYFKDIFPKALQKVKEIAEKPLVITIETEVQAPIEKIWKHWNEPAEIVKWATASDDWHTTQSVNDLKVGGQFTSRMEAKDGSMGFDFGGTYTSVVPMKKIAYTMGDGRNVNVDFISSGNGYKIVEKFEAEEENMLELQQGGWQTILNNFKKNVESN